MSIRIRIVDGTVVALCAAETDPMPGDLYLDDNVHHALMDKFSHELTGTPRDPVAAAQTLRDAETELNAWLAEQPDPPPWNPDPCFVPSGRLVRFGHATFDGVDLLFGWTDYGAAVVWRKDRQEIVASWDSLQRLKNFLFGPDVRAVEVFPEADQVCEGSGPRRWFWPVGPLSVGWRRKK